MKPQSNHFSLLDCPIGFSDGVITGYDMRDSTLCVNVVAWDESSLTLMFSSVLYFQDRGGRQLASVLEIADVCSLVLSAIGYHFTTTPEPILHHLFQLIDLDDVPVLEVVAMECNVEVNRRVDQG